MQRRYHIVEYEDFDYMEFWCNIVLKDTMRTLGKSYKYSLN